MAKKCPPCKEAPGWLTTFSDLMSLLMTFFVLLFSMSSVDAKKYEQAVQSLSETLAGGKGFSPEQQAYFNSSNSPATQNAPRTAKESFIDELKPLYESLIETYQNSGRDGQQIKMVLDKKKGLIRITFPESISFDPGRAALKRKFRYLLHKLFLLKDEPIHVMVVGHTDKRPIHGGRFRSNWELSAARAAAVADELIESGIFKPEQVEVVGKAATEPVDPRDTPEAYAKNRRVEILVKPNRLQQQKVIQQVKQLQNTL